MRKQGFRSRTVKKYKATTNSNHTLPIQDNMLNREFQATKPGEKWVSDITYIWTVEGWLYLVSVIAYQTTMAMMITAIILDTFFYD